MPKPSSKRFTTLKAAVSVVLLFLAACSTPKQNSVKPTSHYETRNCVLVVGGGGPISLDKQFNQYWDEINVKISESISKELQARNIDSRKKYITRDTDISIRKIEIGRELSRTKCDKILQIDHIVYLKNGQKYFLYDISLFKLDNAVRDEFNKSWVVTLPEPIFHKKYEQPLTQYVLDHFSLSLFAKAVVDDLGDSVFKSAN